MGIVDKTLTRAYLQSICDVVQPVAFTLRSTQSPRNCCILVARQFVQIDLQRFSLQAAAKLEQPISSLRCEFYLFRNCFMFFLSPFGAGNWQASHLQSCLDSNSTAVHRSLLAFTFKKHE